MGIFMSLVVFVGAVVAYFFVRQSLQKKRLETLRHTPPPAHWQAILDQHSPVVARLSSAHRSQLIGAMQVFLDHVDFEGCADLEITDEIRVTIAAQACLLLIGRKHSVYPRLKTILVYPHTYVSGRKGVLGGDNGEGARLGESWGCGVVVLSWNSVDGGASNFEDGHNVTLHEFAHQLDQETGAADGAPFLSNRSAYGAWGRVLSADYAQLCAKTTRGKQDVMDDYGATNPAEFFAVATETFFEKPRQLQKDHPKLYAELQGYYQVNPIDWA